jgi:predicted HAD superfamily Cof-like phosphohydrolase
VAFNQKAGLLDKGYSDFLESSFQIEEALEGFNEHGLVDLGEALANYKMYDIVHHAQPKELSRAIVTIASRGNSSSTISDVERLDKACDAVVFAVGSMAKLRLNAQEITQALNIVMKYNNMKLSAPKDEFGKQMKPEGWTGPEPELQLLLDKRSK